MNYEIELSRQLWVIPPDLFRVGTAEVWAGELQGRFNCDVWLFLENTALAFSARGLLTNKGMAIDYPKELEITRPLSEFVDSFLVRSGDSDGTDLRIPDDRFWIRMLLQT